MVAVCVHLKEPVQSSSKIDDEENMENERQEQVDVHCDIKEDYKYSNELHDFDSKQVRFEENGEEGTANHVGNENGKYEHSTTENDIPKTNGVDEEEKDDDDKDTPTPSGDDETEQQQETPTAELDEEKNEDEEESQTTDNLDTTEESQRDSFAGSELSEDARPEEEENEKDIIQSLQKESQYDRTSSFSSLSVNIGSTQQDSDSELQISSRASPEGDIGEESFDRTSIDNEENFEEEEGEVDAEELEKDEDESEEKDESKEEREGRLVKQAHLDMALSLDTQEELEDDDHDKAAASEEPTSEDDTMATANTGLEATKDKEEYVEEDEKDIEEEPKAETEKVPEVFVSFEKKDDEEEEVDESEQGEQEETKQEPVSKGKLNLSLIVGIDLKSTQKIEYFIFC